MAAVDEPEGGERLPRFTRRAALIGALGIGVAACASHTDHSCPNGCAPRQQESPTVRNYEEALRGYRSSPQISPEENNESGGLAWGTSYFLLSLLRAYQATHDRGYLTTFVRHADAVLRQTDQARGVTDYHGRSGPVWRAGGRYSAAAGTLLAPTGAPILRMRYAGPDSGRASVTASPGSAPSTFSLILTHPETGSEQVTDVSTDPRHNRYVDAIVLRQAYRSNAPWTAEVVGQGVPAAVRTTLEPAFNVLAVCTGMISYPLAFYARLVLADPELRRGLKARAERYLSAAEDAVTFHDGEWSATGAGYVAPKGSPVALDGTDLPFNQSHAMGQTLAELYRVTRHSLYGGRVEAMAARWRSALRVGEHGGQIWSYWPPWSRPFQGYTAADRISVYSPITRPAHRWEDISHGAITVEFAVAAHGAGIGITDDDLATLSRTYLRELQSGHDTVREQFDGAIAGPTYAKQSARWIALGDRAVSQHADAVIRQIDPAPITGAVILGRGYLVWAAARGVL